MQDEASPGTAQPLLRQRLQHGDMNACAWWPPRHISTYQAGFRGTWNLSKGPRPTVIRGVSQASPKLKSEILGVTETVQMMVGSASSVIGWNDSHCHSKQSQLYGWRPM